jgi:hypothetical protein
MHEIVLSAPAERDFKRLPAAILPRVIAAIRAVADNPSATRCRS